MVRLNFIAKWNNVEILKYIIPWSGIRMKIYAYSITISIKKLL